MGARVLKKLSTSLGADSFRLASFLAGDKRNAIPREAFATVLVAPAQRAAAEAVVAAELAALKLEYGAKEANLQLALAAADAAEQCLAPGAAKALLDLVSVLPNGPQKFSHAVEGLVETSTNVASVKVSTCGRRAGRSGGLTKKKSSRGTTWRSRALRGRRSRSRSRTCATR